jgi:hypothetical protein
MDQALVLRHCQSILTILLSVAHLNTYVPDDVAIALKREAESAGVPLSRFMLSRVTPLAPAHAWPPGFFEKSCGFLAGDMDEPPDPLPEPLDARVE